MDGGFHHRRHPLSLLALAAAACCVVLCHFLVGASSTLKLRKATTHVAPSIDSQLFRGFYDKTWDDGDAKFAPSDTNAIVTFCGSFPSHSSFPAACRAGPARPYGDDMIAFLSFGGGNEAGRWTQQAMQDVINYLDTLVDLGYDGVQLDIESGDEIDISVWQNLYKAIKGGDLKLCITTSLFAPFGIVNADELVTDWLQSSEIDYLSPKLYSNGGEVRNIWQGYNEAYTSCKPKLVPSIVDSTLYASVPLTVVQKLPNSVGYIQWADKADTPPPPAVPCVSSTFAGVGCRSMCAWCTGALGTSEVYWESDVCDCATGSGSPMAGVIYKCCIIGTD